jgi:hypothetical protein
MKGCWGRKESDETGRSTDMRKKRAFGGQVGKRGPGPRFQRSQFRGRRRRRRGTKINAVGVGREDFFTIK